jgi:hypothetical protein
MYEQASESFARWVAQKDIDLAEHESVMLAAKRLFLSRKYVTATRKREKAATITEWLDAAFIDSERVAWFANYLIDIHGSRWHVTDPILRLIVDRFEVPKQHRPFWDSLPASVIAAVELWLKDVELTRLLGDNEGPRIQFWREFLPRMAGSAKSKDGAAVFICFDNWFAVQFRDMGKATYMFLGQRGLLMRMGRLYESKLYAAVLQEPNVGRYTHQGYSWQDRARSVVRSVLSRYSS